MDSFVWPGICATLEIGTPASTMKRAAVPRMSWSVTCSSPARFPAASKPVRIEAIR
jgi:hypothetical protein